MSAPLAVLCHIPRTGARRRKSLPAAPSWPHCRENEQLVCRDAVGSGERRRRVLGWSLECTSGEWGKHWP